MALRDSKHSTPLAPAFLITGVLALVGSVLSWLELKNVFLILVEEWFPLFLLLVLAPLTSSLFLAATKGESETGLRQVASILLGIELGLFFVYLTGASCDASY
jgi:hypothetical protein